MGTRTRVWALVTLASWGLGCGTSGAEESSSADPGTVAAAGQSGEVPDAATALRLRGQGSQGLRRALELYDAADRSEDPQEWERFVDTVAGARDTSTARLFWETDLARAKAEAKRRGLPILSLRMLGDLRDELSCANSRFFRTTLYADPDVSESLREDFVLHWSSEREVPVVEITFGDGRTIKTTTTGNSIHYLLDADGLVLDAAPGLYSTGGFARVLQEMKSLAEGGPDAATVRAHHERAQLQAEDKMASWLSRYGPDDSWQSWWCDEPSSELRPGCPGSFNSAPPPRPQQPPTDLALALGAQRVTASKAMIEVPTLRALGAREVPAIPREQALDQVFAQLTALGTVAVLLSEPAQALIRRDRPPTPGESASDHEARLAAMMQRFQSTIATDELKNEYDLRISLHRWLADDNTDRSFEVFNERVYRELFLTAASDPWLGLVDSETYDGLIEAGITRMPG